MTISINMTPEKKSALEDAATRLLEAAMDYHDEYRKAGLAGAVVWVKDSDGRMVVLTRGEYRHTLMQNIDRIYNDVEDEDAGVLEFDPPIKRRHPMTETTRDQIDDTHGWTACRHCQTPEACRFAGCGNAQWRARQEASGIREQNARDRQEWIESRVPTLDELREILGVTEGPAMTADQNLQPPLTQEQVDANEAAQRRYLPEMPPMPTYALHGGYSPEDMRAYGESCRIAGMEEAAVICEETDHGAFGSHAFRLGVETGSKGCAAAIRAAGAPK
jgi:hypothetical protein